MSKLKKSKKKESRHLTAILLFEKTAFVPRKASREKLAKAGRMKDLRVLATMNQEDIEEMIMKKFSEFVTSTKPSSIMYYKADRSDLVNIEFVNAEDLFDLVGHGSLYIYIDCSTIKLSAVPSDECATLVNSDEIVKKQLTDPLVGQLWLEQAGLIDNGSQECDLDQV